MKKDQPPKKRVFMKSFNRVVCLLAIFSFMTMSSFAQISVKANKQSIRTILKSIEKQTDYAFFYNEGLLDLDKTTSINVKDLPVEDALNLLLKETNITFKKEGKTIVLTPKVKTQQPSVQKSNKITGTVTDTQGEPIIGASVKLEGSNNGTITNIDGKFSFDLPQDGKLSISYIGYATTSVFTAGKTKINVTLQEDIKALEEVVVIGYGTMKKVNLSGAVASISSKMIENRPLVNVGQGLQGAIANLNVTIGDGNANTAPKFNIRGTTSLTGGQPFILVDNIPVTPDELSRINTNDIENISVLKDASSAAIYGARASFGVILITTKSAKTEKMKVDVNAFYSTRCITRKPKYMTDPYSVMDIKNQAAYPLYNLYNKQQMDIAKQISDNPSMDRVILNPTDKNYYMYLGSTDWLNEVYENYAPSYTINANVSRRNDKGGYYLSTEYFNQDGMFKFGNDIYQRYNMRSKVDYQIANWLNVSNNTTFTYRKYDKPYVGLDGFFNTINRTNSLDVPYNPDGSYTKSGATTIGLLNNGGREIQNNHEFQTTFGLQLDIIKNILQIKADATFRRKSSFMKESQFARYYKEGPDQALKSTGELGLARNTSSYTNYSVYNIYGSFNKTFAKKHEVTALIGFNQENQRYNDYWMSRDRLISQGYPTAALASGDFKGGESIEEWSLRGTFGRLGYIYNKRYIFELNGRYDGTSRFPQRDRFGFFPSGSVAWNVTEENFMKNFKEKIGLDQLKFRASYGSLGNQDVSAYAYLASMGAGDISWILDGKKPSGISAPGLVSSSLTWEKVSTKNFGVDLAMLNQRLMANIDIYERTTKDMLTKGVTLPNVLGVSEPKENAADLKTTGWELGLTWADNFMLGGSKFNYSAKIAISDSKTKITRYDNKTGSLSDWRVGETVGDIWGLTTDGYFQTSEELKTLDQSAVGEDDNSYRFYVGDLKFKDLNGDGKINRGKWTADDHGDFKVIGNSATHYPYSVDLNADWKGFDFRAFLQGIGQKDWYPNGGNHYFWGVYAQPWTNVQEKNLDHWTPENPNAYFPRVKAYIAEDTGSELACSQTKYLQDASYLRLKNLTFGYTLPYSLTKKHGISKMRIYFSGENLFEITHLDGNKNLDPESLSGGVYPMQRTYSFGLNINF
jgi:TonB-linked SusC/RagA family outer membrane protein